MIYSLPQIIEYDASVSPDKDAFRCLDVSISYKDLLIKSRQLSSYLIETGIQKGDRVAIYMNRCLDTAVAVYGILMSGAVYVPIDPFTPVLRTLFILQDCGISHIVTTTLQEKKIRAIVREPSSLQFIIGISMESGAIAVPWDKIFKRSLKNYEPPRILEQDLAFILYTSGSTGIPKGIMHTHYSGLSLAKIAAAQYGFNENDRIGTFAPLHFDPSTFGYLVSPLVGATAIIIPDAYLTLPVSLSALVEKEKITVWYSVPLMLIQLLIHGEIQKHDFSSLRWVLFAGEVFITKHLRALMKIWPHANFSNLYGPAEVILCTFYDIGTPPETDDPIPIGTVWENTEYKILDSRGMEVERGQAGELVVRTATMMSGYWNNKELTERSFFRISVAEGYDHIYYRTGDLVKQNDLGELLFLGRNDRQIKLRGYRIELDEVEQTFLKHSKVQEVAVVVFKGEDDSRELYAVVRPTGGSALDTREIIDFCSSLLPSYAIPDVVEVMHDFPRTSSGKIDRKEIVKILTASKV